jgi:hypothetical protein
VAELLSTDLVARLRAGTYVEGDECALNEEAAAEIERLERERAEWSGIAAVRNRNIALIAEERDRMRNALIDARSWILDNGPDVNMTPAVEGIERALGCFRPAHDVPVEPKPCEHLRSELLAEKACDGEPLFQMRKCLDCSKTFRVRTSLTR